VAGPGPLEGPIGDLSDGALDNGTSAPFSEPATPDTETPTADDGRRDL
jgi:hypothetical protein